jgi:hypothetical protein
MRTGGSNDRSLARMAVSPLIIFSIRLTMVRTQDTGIQPGMDPLYPFFKLTFIIQTDVGWFHIQIDGFKLNLQNGIRQPK